MLKRSYSFWKRLYGLRPRLFGTIIIFDAIGVIGFLTLYIVLALLDDFTIVLFSPAQAQGTLKKSSIDHWNINLPIPLKYSATLLILRSPRCENVPQALIGTCSCLVSQKTWVEQRENKKKETSKVFSIAKNFANIKKFVEKSYINWNWKQVLSLS